MKSGSVGDRAVVSIMKACEMLQVSRRTLYRYISQGYVDYVRDVGGSLRIYVDSLEHVESHLRENRKRQRLQRRARPSEPGEAKPIAVAGAPTPASEVSKALARDLPLFQWSGRPQLVRNLGRPVGAECPCCGTRLKTDNTYDSLEPEYETEEDLSCLLCGWACHYQCRPLTRGLGSQFYIVATLRLFQTPITLSRGLLQQLKKTPAGKPLAERVEEAAPLVFGARAFRILTGHDATELLLAASLGAKCLALYCREAAGHDAVNVQSVSLLRSVNIDWTRRELRMSLRTQPLVKCASGPESADQEVVTSVGEARPFLEFVGVCSSSQPDLEMLTPALREELVAELLRNPYRYHRTFLDLMSADES